MKKKQALFVATKLELASILSNDPTNADEIAKATIVNSRISYHLMRLLISIGIFFGKNNDEFHLNPMGKSLLTGTSDWEHPDFAKILNCKFTIQVGTTQL